MKVAKEDVEKVAVLSRLTIDEKQMPEYLSQFNDFLNYVDVLQKVDTENVEPLAHVLPMQNVFREDKIKPSIDRKLALSNAPEQEDGYFKVPRIIE